MNNVFVYCETEGTSVADVSLELLTKGRKLANQLGCQLEAIVAGSGLEGVEKQVLPFGVDKVHVFDAPGLFPYTSLPHSSILINLFKEEKPQICLMGATVIGRDLGPRVSSALTSGLTADCTSLEIGPHEDKKAGITYIISGLQRRREEITDEWLELYTSYRKDEDWEGIIDNLIEAGFYKMPEDRLSKQMAEKLYGEKIEGSVTRLERFAACAFAHFLSYGLRLKERKEYRFEAVDLGNIFHRAIEIFSRNLVKSGYTWTTLPKEVAEELIEESVETSITDYGNTVLYSSARNEYMITRIKRMMKRTVWALAKQLEKGDFVPSGYEVSFGKGKIDRIDIYETEDRVYVKVIDYKTGTKTFSLASLYHGLQLQLAMYMNMAVELERRKQPEKKVVPAGLFYYQMKDPIIDKVEEDKWEETVLSKLRLDGIVNANEEVINHLDREFSGNSLAIPVGKNKNGSLSKTSKAFSEEEFSIISRYVEKEVKDIEGRMQEGEIEVSPYEMGTSYGCDFCQFKGVCHFDEKIEGCEYRKLGRLSDEEVLKKMMEEL